jgi:CheY-like chemotaxis protein
MVWTRYSTSFSLAYLALTFAYAASGKLALLLAVPPGYASPVFPPAGIAVAAMLISGWASLPWTFLGSLLLNVWSGYTSGGSVDVRVAAALVIAVASTLQAAVGGRVLRHEIGYPAPLDNVRDVTRFFLVSPIFCLTSATLSLAGLWALGVVAVSDLLMNWFSWWLGDTLGVLLVLPLILVIAGEPHDLWRRRRLPVALPMLFFFALFVAIFVRVNRWEHDETLAEFRLVSDEAADKIRTALTEQEVFLEQLERAFTLPGGLSAADFQHLVQTLLQRFPLMQAVEWAPRVDSSLRATFERAKRAEIPGETRTRAFEPFFTTKEIGLGSGLGLSQVYGFAQQSGGKALIDSQIGKGTTITLYLPRAGVSPVAPETAVIEDVAPALSVRVLLVEDDFEVRNVATELLQGIGCQVVQACDGGSALAVLERDPAIEVVISDIAMPGGMSGLELGRIVRQRYPSLPIMLSTGYSEYAAQGMSEGFTLVEKPFRRDTFVESIRAAVRITVAGVRQS